MCPIIQSISSYSFALHFSSRKSALLKRPVVRLATEREKCSCNFRFPFMVMLHCYRSRKYFVYSSSAFLKMGHDGSIEKGFLRLHPYFQTILQYCMYTKIFICFQYIVHCIMYILLCECDMTHKKNRCIARLICILAAI